MQKEENLQFGFICLHRSIRTNWIWKDAEKLKWWLDILLSVNYSEQKLPVKGTLMTCERGQSIQSLQTWALRWQTNVSAVRRFFHLLELDGMIELKNEGKTTRVTVCNYDTYNIEGAQKAKKQKKETPQAPTPEPVLQLFTDEQKTGFEKFQNWIKQNAATVSGMKEPFTIEQYLKLKQKLPWQKIADLIEAMELWEGLKKRTSAYKTLLTFHRRAQERTAA